MRTINADGSEVLIEAVYFRYHVLHREECDTIEQACRYLDYGEEEGALSSVGVFVEGKPHLFDDWRNGWRPPGEEKSAHMLAEYAEVFGRGPARSPSMPQVLSDGVTRTLSFARWTPDTS